MADVLDGFGGFASSFLEYIRDEYAKLPMFVYGLEAHRDVRAQNEVASPRESCLLGIDVVSERFERSA